VDTASFSFLSVFMVHVPAMPTSEWFPQCKTYLNSVKSDLASISALIRNFEENNHGIGCVSLQYSTFAYTIPLGEIRKILKGHVLSLDYETVCGEAMRDAERILRNVSPEDLLFLNQFIAVSIYPLILLYYS
jgi:hypothetical protein